MPVRRFHMLLAGILSYLWAGNREFGVWVEAKNSVSRQKVPAAP